MHVCDVCVTLGGCVGDYIKTKLCRAYVLDLFR